LQILAGRVIGTSKLETNINAVGRFYFNRPDKGSTGYDAWLAKKPEIDQLWETVRPSRIRERRAAVDKFVGDRVWKLLLRCLAADPEERPCMADVLVQYEELKTSIGEEALLQEVACCEF
jgi:hypothetical protein